MPKTESQSPGAARPYGGPPRPPALPTGRDWWDFRGWGGRGWRKLAVAMVVLVVGYFLYFWEVRRVVVPQNHVLVLLKKNGGRSLGGDQVIIPRPPAAGSPEYAEWEKQYGDCNGILEQVYPEGTYFSFSP